MDLWGWMGKRGRGGMLPKQPAPSGNRVKLQNLKTVDSELLESPITLIPTFIVFYTPYSQRARLLENWPGLNTIASLTSDPGFVSSI